MSAVVVESSASSVEPTNAAYGAELELAEPAAKQLREHR